MRFIIWNFYFREIFLFTIYCLNFSISMKTERERGKFSLLREWEGKIFLCENFVIFAQTEKIVEFSFRTSRFFKMLMEIYKLLNLWSWMKRGSRLKINARCYSFIKISETQKIVKNWMFSQCWWTTNNPLKAIKH